MLGARAQLLCRINCVHTNTLLADKDAEIAALHAKLASLKRPKTKQRDEKASAASSGKRRCARDDVDTV